MANITIHKNAFRPALNVEQREATNITVQKAVIESGFCEVKGARIVRTTPFLVTLNGVALLQKEWDIVLTDQDFLQIVLLPRGGGGSNLGNILGAVLVAAMAYFTGGLSLAMSAALGVATYAGMTLLTGAMTPPSMPTNATSKRSESPTYTLEAQGNVARLMEACPRLYGYMRTYPDLASQPYSEYQNNELVLYQLFAVSLGDVDIEEIYVDDNLLSNFDDAEFQIIKPGDAVTLFPDNVVTSDAVSGFTLLGPNQPEYAIVGPFATNPPGTECNRISVDIALPRGAGTINDDGVTVSRSVSFLFQYREIDDEGAAIGAWQTLINKTLKYSASKPILLTFGQNVTAGRYEVRARKTSESSTDNRSFDDLQWQGLKGYLQSQFVYPDMTLLAVKMTATNVLNSNTARKFSVYAKSRLQKWNPAEGWTPAEQTNNIAWIAADALRNPDYGRGLPTSRLNMPELYRLSQVWESRGDTFNGVFDSSMQFWNALSQILKMGRATPIYYTGIIDFVRDEPATVPRAMFQPSNMVAGSFETTYQFFGYDTPDYVEVAYIDDETWTLKTVDCKIPGRPATKPFKLDLTQGCTNRAQAWREGISLAAANFTRRRSMSINTNEAGMIPRFNSLVRLSHDVPQWGYSGRVLSLNKSNGLMVTSEPIEIPDGETWVIGFRKRDGSEDGPYTIEPNPNVNSDDGTYGCRVIATPTQLNQIYISNGVKEDFTFYQCGPTEREGLLALTTSCKPTADGKIALSFINYAEAVHTAELGGVIPTPPPSSNLPSTPVAPIVDFVELFYTYRVGVQNVIASPANGAIYYEFQAKEAGEDTWILLQQTASNTIETNLTPGNWSVRARGVGKAIGPWATWAGTVEASTLPSAKLDLFVATSELFAIELSFTVEAESASIARFIELWFSADNQLGNATILERVPYPGSKHVHSGLQPGQRFYYWGRVIDEAGRVGIWFNDAAPITAIASDDASAILEMLTGQISESQLASELLTVIEGGEGAVVEVEALRDELAAMYTIKTQLTVDNIPYMAGIGVGVENNEGIVTSQILLSAQRVAIINEVGGALFTPFIVDGANVYLSNAFIDNASIGSAKFTDWLYSDALNTLNQPKIQINFRTGAAEFSQITVKDNDGNVVLNSAGGGVIVSAENVTGLGDFAFLDQINGSNVTTYMDNAAIGTAQMGVASVETLTLAGNAVTIPASSYTGGVISFGNSFVTVATVSISSSGAPISIIARASLSTLTGSITSEYATLEYRIVCTTTGAVIMTSTIGVRFNQIGLAVASGLYTRGIGTATFALQVRHIANGSNLTASSRFIQVLEVKR